jgi:hypothetical protein
VTLQAAEQESLLLRQVAALRRGGHGHDQALDLARKGLRQGALADRVDAALRALAAGGEAASDPLLAGGQAPVESLDHAAAAADAQLSADAALAMVRTYLVVALAGPLLIGCLLGWLAPAPTPAAVAGSFDRPLAWQSLGQVLAILKVAGLPLAVAVVAVVRRVDWRIASGVEQVRRASMLFRAAAIGADPADLLADGVERTWVSARASSCGVPQATAELAEELLRDAEGSLALFRHLAPVVALLVGLVLLIPVFVALMLPIWGSMRGLIG